MHEVEDIQELAEGGLHLGRVGELLLDHGNDCGEAMRGALVDYGIVGDGEVDEEVDDLAWEEEYAGKQLEAAKVDELGAEEVQDSGDHLDFDGVVVDRFQMVEKVEDH